MTTDFTAVTEVAGSRATREQLQMIQTRYAEAARLAHGRRVLEVACGTGRGLGLIANGVRFIVGGDYTFSLAQRGAAHYRERVPFVQLDAEALPFVDHSFDLILMFEAIYYLPDAGRFLRECHRTLASDGMVMICSANCESPEFTSSAFATRFYSARQLAALMEAHGFRTRLMAAFEIRPAGLASRLVSFVRLAALALHLVPSTLAGRERLKRIFYGPLTTLKPEMGEDDARTIPLVPIDPDQPVRGYKVIFAFGQASCGGVNPE